MMRAAIGLRGFPIHNPQKSAAPTSNPTNPVEASQRGVSPGRVVKNRHQVIA